MREIQNKQRNQVTGIRTDPIFEIGWERNQQRRKRSDERNRIITMNLRKIFQNDDFNELDIERLWELNHDNFHYTRS
jgi:hypothetical protein